MILRIRARGIDLRAANGNQRAVGGDDVDLDALERNGVARVKNRPLAGTDAQIRIAPALIGRLDEIAAVEAAADRHGLRERDETACVVGVIVTENEIVDLLEARLLYGCSDPLRVAAVHFPAGIVEKRLARRRHDKRRRPAFDVNPVELEIPWLRSSGRAGRHYGRQGHKPRHGLPRRGVEAMWASG